MLGQSVAAKNKNIAFLKGAGDDFEFRIVLNSDRACNNVVRPIPGFLGGHHAAREHLLKFGMVTRHLPDCVTPHQVKPAVTRPYASIVVLRDEQDRNRGSDDGAATLTTHLDNLAVCEKDPVFRFFKKPNCRVRGRDRVEGADDELAGHVPRIVPAHAVGNGPEASVGPHQMRVLIARPHPPRVRGGTGIKFERRLVHRYSAPLYEALAISSPASLPVNMLEYRNGSGMPRAHSAIGGKFPPPSVHQKLAAAEVS